MTDSSIVATQGAKAGAPVARLRFRSDWSIGQEGRITPGGLLVIDYDVTRLPNVRARRRGVDLSNMVAWIKTDWLHDPFGKTGCY